MNYPFLSILLSACFFISSIISGGESEQIVVKLSTENPLMPLYLAKVSGDGSSEYLQQMDDTLRFDLNVNGMTRVVKSSSDNEVKCSNGNLKSRRKLRHGALKTCIMWSRLVQRIKNYQLKFFCSITKPSR